VLDRLKVGDDLFRAEKFHQFHANHARIRAHA
jgi:hypothetical protein